MNDNKHQGDQHAGVRTDWDKAPPAGTTQRVKHGDVPSTEITLRQAEALVDVFGGHDAEVSIIQRPDAWPHLDLGLYAYFTEYPGEGTFYLGPTDVDDDLAANGRAPGARIRTWRDRLGRPADFPLHAPTDVERAMEAEIAELRVLAARPAAGRAQEEATADMLDMLGRIEPLAMHDKKERDQWFERLCRARAVQQPLPVPDQAAVVWRSDLVRAVAELIQLRAYRDIVRAKGARENAGTQPADVLTVPMAIMDIKVDQLQSDEYKRGHRDARHVAADLVLELADKLAAIAKPAAEQQGGGS